MSTHSAVKYSNIVWGIITHMRRGRVTLWWYLELHRKWEVAEEDFPCWECGALCTIRLRNTLFLQNILFQPSYMSICLSTIILFIWLQIFSLVHWHRVRYSSSHVSKKQRKKSRAKAAGIKIIRASTARTRARWVKFQSPDVFKEFRKNECKNWLKTAARKFFKYNPDQAGAAEGRKEYILQD